MRFYQYLWYQVYKNLHTLFKHYFFKKKIKSASGVLYLPLGWDSSQQPLLVSLPFHVILLEDCFLVLASCWLFEFWDWTSLCLLWLLLLVLFSSFIPFPLTQTRLQHSTLSFSNSSIIMTSSPLRWEVKNVFSLPLTVAGLVWAKCWWIQYDGPWTLRIILDSINRSVLSI